MAKRHGMEAGASGKECPWLRLHAEAQQFPSSLVRKSARLIRRSARFRAGGGGLAHLGGLRCLEGVSRSTKGSGWAGLNETARRELSERCVTRTGASRNTKQLTPEEDSQLIILLRSKQGTAEYLEFRMPCKSTDYASHLYEPLLI